jgi:hypothetical protein
MGQNPYAAGWIFLVGLEREKDLLVATESKSLHEKQIDCAVI